MKRFICALLIVFLFVTDSFALAAGFSQNPDKIEQAAKSVLLLEIYDKRGKLIATGSGFVAFDSSTLVTNYHVIEDAAKVIAYSDDDKSYTIDKVFCADKEIDIAILGFSSDSGLTPLKLKADKNLKRGASVVAIGSPKGIKNTVSTGIISVINVDSTVPEIQFTAPVSHGSSGGALFNDNGEVIGVTSATLAAESQNINFAIDISIVKAMYNGWNGNIYTLSNHKSKATLDYSNVYDSDNASVSEYYVTSTDEVWTCPECGNKNTARFCSECGTEKPLWQCKCGQINSGKFCIVCGSSLQTMLENLNNALSYMDKGQYDSAVECLETLCDFNCMSIASNAGKNISASDMIGKAYYLCAERMLAQRDFAGAYDYFDKAGDYSDAAQRLYEVFYKQGKYQITISKYDEAIESFETASEIYDVSEDIACCHYLKAKQYVRNNQFDDAINEYQKAGTYMEAPDCIKQTYYDKGEYLLAQKKYDEAVAAFSAAEDYSDAKSRILSVYYVQGLQAEQQELLDVAVEWYTKAGAYSDATEKIIAIKKQQQEDKERKLIASYKQADTEYQSGEYSKAIELFKQLDGYADSDERILQCYYMLGEKYAALGQYEAAETYYKQASGHEDAEDKRVEMIYLQALELGIANEKQARSLLKGILDYDKAQELYTAITYEKAEEYYDTGAYSTAIAYYQDCADYLDSADKLYTCYVAVVKTDLLQGKYTAAEQWAEKTLYKTWSVSNAPMLEPGDEGQLVKKALSWAKGMSFLEWYPTDEKVYQEKYKYAIQRMEKNFDLDADGIITYREFELLDGVTYPSCKSSEVKDLLEYVSDLGYFDALGKLPDEHSTYETRYQYSIKRLETDLKLKADGFLTEGEIAVIKKQPITAPEKVAKVTLTTSGGAVNVSWTSAKGAKWYIVYRNGKEIATTTSTYYYDKDAIQGVYNNYVVYSCKYSKLIPSKSAGIMVDPVYKWASCYEISTKYSEYVNKYVSLESAKIIRREAKGKDYYFVLEQKVNNKSYYVGVVLEDYTNWNWTNKNGKSKLMSMSYFTGKGKVIGKKTISYYTNIPLISLTSISY